jgi:GAF domain-containing protein
MSVEQDWERDQARFVGPPPAVDDPAVDTEVRRRRGEFGPLAAQFAALAERLFSAGTAADVLDRVVYSAADLVPEADFASVTLRKGKSEFETPVSTDAIATRLDEVQYRTGEGPCVDATRHDGDGIAVDHDLRNSPQWPRFGPAAADLGVRSVICFGLLPNAPAPRLGALNLYSREPSALTEVDRDVGLLLAAHAGAAIAAARSLEAADLRVTNLERALLSRDVIGQAKGMLMAQRGITAEEAFDVLRSASQNLNIKLAHIAEAITDRRITL